MLTAVGGGGGADSNSTSSELNDSPGMGQELEPLYSFLSQNNLDAELGTAEPASTKESGEQQAFPEEREKQEIWAVHNGYKDQTVSLMEPQASQGNAKPFLGKKLPCFSNQILSQESRCCAGNWSYRARSAHASTEAGQPAIPGTVLSYVKVSWQFSK